MKPPYRYVCLAILAAALTLGWRTPALAQYTPPNNGGPKGPTGGSGTR
jgi:hypothetical protein